MIFRAALVAVALGLTACATLPEGLQPVSGFDAQRYLGRWHEVARLDHRFERGLVQVTAEYAAREDGGITVRNQGWDCEDGEWSGASGRAYPVGATDVGQFKVSFFRPFYSGYNILVLDPEYRYAMVAGDDRSYLWILARQPQLDPQVLSRLVAQAAGWGFATQQLIYPGATTDCSPAK